MEKFRQLVQDFSNHNDFTPDGNLTFKQKERQLIEFSENVHSLVVCLSILESDSDERLLFFSSQFIKDKLKFSFEQLSEVDVQETHARIAVIMVKRTDFKKIIMINLSRSLAYIYLHCYTTKYQAIDFLQVTFYGEDSAATLSIPYYKYLFMLLDSIPNELSSKKFVIDEIKRHEIEDELASQQVRVLKKMHELFLEVYPHKQHFLNEDFENLLYAFAEWIRILSPPPEVTSVLHNHSLISFALTSMNSNSALDLSESATEVLLVCL